MPNYIQIPNLAHTASYRDSLTKIITRLQKMIIIKYLEQVIKSFTTFLKYYLPLSDNYPFHATLNDKQTHIQDANAIINIKKNNNRGRLHFFLFKSNIYAFDIKTIFNFTPLYY